MTKHAFLVGVAEYDSPTISPVHFAARDAEVIGGVLRDRCGFQATVLSNPGQGDFVRSLNNLVSVIEGSDDLFCFFFAGHGVEYEQESFLLLKDALPEDRVGMYQLSALRDKFARLRCKNRLVFLDCCRNDPRSGRGDAANLMGGRLSAALNHLVGRDIGPAASGADGEHLTLLLNACRVGERAYEWEARRHGAFSWFLKEGLEGAAWRDGALSAHDLCKYVAVKVRDWAGKQGVSQNPDFRQDSAAGDIVLVGPDPSEAAAREQKKTLMREAIRKAAAEEVARLQREAAERERRAEAARQEAERQAEETARKLREAEDRARVAERRAEELARAQSAGLEREREAERKRQSPQPQTILERRWQTETERKRQAEEEARKRAERLAEVEARRRREEETASRWAAARRQAEEAERRRQSPQPQTALERAWQAEAERKRQAEEEAKKRQVEVVKACEAEQAESSENKPGPVMIIITILFGLWSMFLGVGMTTGYLIKKRIGAEEGLTDIIVRYGLGPGLLCFGCFCIWIAFSYWDEGGKRR